MKNFHLDLVRVTEAGAINAAEWVGRGDKEQADLAATDAMRDRLNKVDFAAKVAIGEGKKDNSHGLYEGELVGTKMSLAGACEQDVRYSIAIDPIEGTTPTAKGGYEAMSVIALAQNDCFYKTETHYMQKLAVGPKISGVNVSDPIDYVVRIVAAQLNKPPQHITVCVMDRPRHNDLVQKLREIGCRIKFITDCDVTACIAACEPDSGIDLYYSIGGAPEAVISAAAMKCMDGNLTCREWDGKNFGPVLEMEDLAKGHTMFAATGITDGKLLKGVKFTEHGPVTNSIAMRSKSKTTRRMTTQHGN